MRKLLYLFVLSTIFIIGCSEKPRLKIACVGDSLTYGLGVEDITKDSYPAILGKMMGDTSHVRNFGSNRRAVINKADYPYINEKIYKEALKFDPDIVVIMLGTNDTKPNNWVYKDDYKKDMESLVESFQKLSSHPQIYLCYPLKPHTDPKGHRGISDSIIVSYIIPYINEVAQEYNLKVIDTYTPMSNSPELFPDSVHPNKEGTKVLAEVIYKEITKNKD